MDACKRYEAKECYDDIVISTRVRLARNIADYPFPGHMTAAQQKEVLNTVSSAVKECDKEGFTLTELKGMDDVGLASMVERHLISPEMAVSESVRGVLMSPDKKISVMINEEDHVRIQAIQPGFRLEECMAEAGRIDDLLDSSVACAFDEKWGYLTHCPTNLGTGLRASVMLHLPALTETGRIRNLVAAANKLGFAVRGLYGEGSAAKGAIYQISNQLTLGISEEETIRRLSDAVIKILDEERGLRKIIRDDAASMLEDRVWRAAGILSTARRLKSDEAMSLISDLRIGISIGEIKGIGIEDINRLLWEIQPACLSENEGKLLKEDERDIKRADLVRKIVKPAILNS